MLYILLIGLAIKVYIFLSLTPWQEETIQSYILIKDAYTYDQLAKNLIKDQYFGDSFLFRTPGYPAFLALNYKLFSYKIYAVFIVQIILSLWSAIIFFKTIRLLYSNKAAYWGVFLFVIDPFQSVYNVSLLTETLFVFLFLSSLFLLINGLNNEKYSITISAGILIGLAALVRPILIYFPLLLLFLLPTNILNNNKKKGIILFASAYVLTMFTWAIHNYSSHGEFQISSLKGRKLFLTNIAYSESLKTGKSVSLTKKELLNKAIAEGLDTTNFESYKNSDLLIRMSKEYIKTNFTYYLKASAEGVVDLYGSFYSNQLNRIFRLDTPRKFEKIVSHSYSVRLRNCYLNASLGKIVLSTTIIFYLFLNYIFALLGIIFLLKMKNFNEYFLIVFLIIAYFTIITGPMADVRFRTPFMPFIQMFAAIGIFSVNFTNKKSTSLPK